jgi:hypothetical protein
MPSGLGNRLGGPKDANHGLELFKPDLGGLRDAHLPRHGGLPGLLDSRRVHHDRLLPNSIQLRKEPPLRLLPNQSDGGRGVAARSAERHATQSAQPAPERGEVGRPADAQAHRGPKGKVAAGVPLYDELLRADAENLVRKHPCGENARPVACRASRQRDGADDEDVDPTDEQDERSGDQLSRQPYGKPAVVMRARKAVNALLEDTLLKELKEHAPLDR